MSKKQAKYVIQTAFNNQYYFLLVAPNGKIICTSEMYDTKRATKNGIKSVQKNGNTEIIIDKSDWW
jgi:uncharacterized protein